MEKVIQPIDENTDRPYGDHGTAEQAIDFAISNHCEDPHEFLVAWRDGDASEEWPEYYEGLEDN